MIGVALKGLAGRKVRALLTALAVVIGISMVSGTYILTDTMQKSFDGLFTATLDETDAVISGKEIVKGTTTGSAKIPAALLTKVQKLDEVGAAGGVVSPDQDGAADILGPDGKPVARESVAGSYDPAHAEFSPLTLKSGSWPKGPQQVVIDAGTAAKQHYEVGDAVKVSTFGAKRSYELTGIVRYGDVDSLGFASIAAWDLKTAQTLLHREGSYDSISIAAAKGTSSKELVRAVAPLVPGNLQVKDSAKQAKDEAQELNSSMSILKYFLLGFGGIALLVGAFVIFNTLSITVAQRTREFATLRTLGASRKQVMRSVVAEGIVIGLLASVIGLVVGIGLAKGLVALFSATGVELPDAATVIAPRTIVLSIVVGTLTTLVASILPAKRATRVPPIAAVREGSTLPASRFAAHTHKAGVDRRGGVARGAAGRAVRRRAQHDRPRRAARRRRARRVPRHGAAGAAPGHAAGPPRGLAGAPARHRRGAGRRERRPQPGTDRVDRGRADDRAHARDARGRARLEPRDRHQGGHRGRGPRRLRHRRQAERAVQGRRGHRAGEGAGRQERLARPLRHGADRRQGARDLGHRPGHDRGLLHVHVGQGLRAVARPSSGPTGRS